MSTREEEKLIHRRQCVTSYGAPKKTFNVFEDAVEWAKKQNLNPRTIHKQVAYKCHVCYKFHTGRSLHNTLLYHKEKIYEQ
jgi:hypothetical protein